MHIVLHQPDIYNIASYRWYKCMYIHILKLIFLQAHAIHDWLYDFNLENITPTEFSQVSKNEIVSAAFHIILHTF